MEADMVAPSLDAVTDDTLMKINRPYKDLSAELLIEGLEKFSQEFKGKIWLEIMLIKGINDHPEELKQMVALTHDLKLNKIHLNTVVRPPAENFAKALTSEEMQRIANMFDDRAEVIVDFDKLVLHETPKGDIELEILSLLKRRPCTIGDISNSLGLHRNEVIKYIEKLVTDNSIKRSKQGEKWYYEKV
jgi:wyosine [tRNA(Phe)-imidazoG37] synthetase (radical SAM superfamily)